MTLTAVEYVALVCGKLIQFAERQDMKEELTAMEWKRRIKGSTPRST